MLLNCGVGEDSWQSLGLCKEIQPVYPKGNQSWIFIGRTDIEAETPILWPPDTKSWLIAKTLMLGKIEGRRRRGQTEDEMVGWHRRLNGHEFEQTPGDSEGKGSLACCSPWGLRGEDRTEQLNNNTSFLESSSSHSVSSMKKHSLSLF